MFRSLPVLLVLFFASTCLLPMNNEIQKSDELFSINEENKVDIQKLLEKHIIVTNGTQKTMYVIPFMVTRQNGNIIPNKLDRVVIIKSGETCVVEYHSSRAFYKIVTYDYSEKNKGVFICGIKQPGDYIFLTNEHNVSTENVQETHKNFSLRVIRNKKEKIGMYDLNKNGQYCNFRFCSDYLSDQYKVTKNKKN